MSDNNPNNNINNNNQGSLEQMNNPQLNQTQKEKSANNNTNDNKKIDEEKQKIISEYEMAIEYENSIRQEIEQTTPLISEELPISILLDDYKSNAEYSTSIKQITDKYKYIRKVRRDGNCFYRSFIYRLFEYICINNDIVLYNQMLRKIEDFK